MSEIISEALPQQHDIYVTVGVINRAHPELSTLVLTLGSPPPKPAVDSINVHQEGADAVKSADTISVKPGDTVTWIIADPEISSILVMDDNKHQNVFESNPAPVQGNLNWSGLIDKKINGHKEETYSICWSQQGMTYCYDPKIVVNT